ncbi:condensation domain-containing protein [Streptomyces megasporus]|uniref:condensation domain-containing protein n=1 Tax=Streptomyces megasporus TaxID=44060 RepID=UPI00056C533F|nr:condensation domain-containing protein [Streptomyces megasporus]
MTTPLDDAERIRLVERQIEAALLQDERIADCAVVFQSATAMRTKAERCVRCGMDTAYPGTVLDEHGVCDLCLMHQTHEKEILSYFGEVDEFVRLVRERSRAAGSEYDCLLLFSGGKDSTYVLHQLVRLGLRVMTFTFDNGFISRTALENVEAITGALGIEHVTMTRADQNRVFVRSLQQHKSVCNGCFRSLLDLSARLAHERGIPSVVTGLSRGQIIDERLLWFYRNGEFAPERIERQLEVGRKVYHQVGSDLSADVLDRVEVIDYYRYSAVTKDDIRAFLQSRETLWSAPKDTGFCSSNCMINDVGVYVHKLERGFHNYESPTRWEVRLGHLSRDEADEELRTPINIPRVKSMLAKIGYTDPDDRSRLGRRMAAYYVPRGEVSEAEVRGAVAGRLPELLLPEYWIELDEIPRTAGAVDRHTLPDPLPDSGKRLAVGGREPADGTDDETAVPFSPVQRFLAEDGGAGPEGRARALLLDLPEGVGAAEVKKAGLQLLLRHTALRSPLVREGDRWVRQTAEPVGQVPVGRLDLSRQDAARALGMLRLATERLRAPLAAGQAPLLRAAVVERPAGARRLLLVVHELAADLAGWRRLLADLAAVLEWSAAGRTAALPPAVDAPAAEPARPRTPAPLPPSVCVLPEEALADGAVETHRTALDAADTAALTGSGAALPALVADAVARALSEWLGAPAAVLGIADHSGELAEGSGWFALTPRPDTTADAVPGHSLGPSAIPVAAPPVASSVRLTHLGDLDALLPGDGPLRLADSPDHDPAAPLAPRPGPLEVVSHVRGGRLHLEWTGAAGLYGVPAETAVAALRTFARQARKATE